MTYKGFGGYACDYCKSVWEEATYLMFVKIGKKTYHVCDVISQSESLTQSNELCLMELTKKEKLGYENMKIERIFGLSED